MDYEILDKRPVGSTMITTVRYPELGVTVDIAHSRPQTIDDIIEGIQNRGLSEKKDLDDSANVLALLPQIKIG